MENTTRKYSKTKEYDFNPSLLEIGVLFTKKNKARITGKKEIIFEGTKRVVVADGKVYEKLVDTAKYIKVYKLGSTLLAFCELSSGSQRLMANILEELDNGVHWFYYSPASLGRKIGVEEYRVSELIKELIDKDWIYKASEPKKYWINLLLVSVGSRTKIYEEYRDTTRGFITEEPSQLN
jgi:hypothetical protein